MSKQKRFSIGDKIFAAIYTGCLIITLITAFLHGLDSQTVYWVTPILMGMPVLWLLIRGRKGRLYDESVYFPFSGDDLDSELRNLARRNSTGVPRNIFRKRMRRLPWEPFDMEKYMMRLEDEKEKHQTDE